MKRIAIIITALILGHITAQGQTPEDYFKTAAENNPGLQAVYLEFEAALQRVPLVSGMPDPTLTFGYFISPVETRVGPQNARFSLTQMFPWFGTLRARGDAAALFAEAKYQAFLDARNKLYYEVASAYYPLYELRKWQRIEEENITILKSYKSIANSRFRNGSGSMVDVLRVDIMLQDATTNLTILNQKEKPLRTAFNKLLNRDEDSDVVVSDTLNMNPVDMTLLRDSLLSNNPGMKALDLRISAAESSEIASRKQGLPSLGVGLDYVLVGERTDMDVPDNGRDILMPMVSVSIPIFRSKYRASVREAQLMQESYARQKEEFLNTLVTGYEMAWFEVQQQRELMKLYRNQIAETQQVLNLLFSAYSNSGKEFEEVLRAQQQLLKYEKLLATAEVAHEIAVAQLKYITAKSH